MEEVINPLGDRNCRDNVDIIISIRFPRNSEFLGVFENFFSLHTTCIDMSSTSLYSHSHK